MTTSVLLIEDNVADSDRIGYLLRVNGQESFELVTVQTLRCGIKKLSDDRFDAVLLDLSFPDASNLEAVLKLTRALPHLPVVVLTGLDDVDLAIASLKHGVQDYLSKDRIDSELLVRSLRYAIERQRIMRQAEQVQEALRRAERLASLGTLAAGIAHEINNPILAAWTSAQAALNLKDDPNAGQLLDDCLQNIIQSVQRCRDTVENILHFARQGEVERCPCDVIEVIQRSIDETMHYAEDRGTTIAWSSAEETPRIMGNALQLQQVIVAVLRNAIEASSVGGEILISSSHDEAVVRVSITDRGRGLTQQEKQRAFDPFFTSGKPTGTGLGLSIAHEIMGRHGGGIELKSTPGCGTTVALTLPIERCDD